MTITLDDDEQEVIDCLIEKSLMKPRIIKYALGHGLDLRDGRPFNYDKHTGEVTDEPM